MEKIIEEFPSYTINMEGTVRSTSVRKTCKVTGKSQPLKHVLDRGNGYYLVTLVDPETHKRKNQFIHRLLAQAFIPNPENKPQVNHIDANKQNNALSNLEWVTSKENSVHAVGMGLCDARRMAAEVAVIQMDDDFNVIAEHVSIHEAGRDTGVAWTNIWKVCNGHRPRAGTFRWKYK